MSVAYRNRGNMTIWWNGYLKNGRTGIIKIKKEWTELFGSSDTPAVNNPSSVSLVQPLNNSTYTAAATVAFTANASDRDGTVTRVEFWAEITLLNADSTSPYAYNWTGIGAGSYTLRAITYDNQGTIAPQLSPILWSTPQALSPTNHRW